MTASRLLAGLLQPLLALLLLAGSPADALSPEARLLVHGIETAPKAIGAQRSGAAIPADTLIEPTRSVNEDGWAGTAVGAKSPLPVRDLGRLTEISRPAYATPQPTHRPCAGPSTGPPLA